MKSTFSLMANTTRLLHCFTLIQQNYMRNDSYIVLLNSDLNLEVPHFRLNYSEAISSTYLFRRKFDFYLMDCSTPLFKNFTDAYSSRPFFNSASRFIFFCDDVNQETLISLKRLGILNVIFLNTSSDDILTYFPYKNRMFREFDVSLEVIGNCGGLQQLPQLFPDKIPKKWVNTTLNILHTFAPPYCIGSGGGPLGIELDVQVLILDRLGMRPNFTNVYVPEVGKRRTILKFLNGRYCDYMIGVSSPTTYFEATVPYIYDELIWYAPTAKDLSKWKYLIEILTKLVWISWLISSVLAIVSLYIADIFLYREWGLTNFLYKCCLFYRLFLEQSVSFRAKYLSEIILITMFIFGTFMMNLVYKSRFFFFLTSARYEDDLKSLQDAMDRSMTIGFLKWHERLFQDNELLMSYLSNHYQSCNMQANCSDQAAFSRNLIVLRPKIKMTYWTRRYLDRNGRPLLKRIENPVSPLFWVAAFSHGHPLFRTINQYIHHLLDYGIMEKILSKYSDKVYPQNIPETHRLTFNHIKAPIIIWAFGTIISTVILVYEIKLRNIGRRYTRNIESIIQNRQHF